MPVFLCTKKQTGGEVCFAKLKVEEKIFWSLPAPPVYQISKQINFVHNTQDIDENFMRIYMQYRY